MRNHRRKSYLIKDCSLFIAWGGGGVGKVNGRRNLFVFQQNLPDSPLALYYSNDHPSFTVNFL